MKHQPYALGPTGRHRENPAVAAARAGERGRHAQPMETARRERAYRAQTGRAELTPRQRRRANKKVFAELRRIPVEVITP